jgi:hypothetical protein
MRQPKLLSPTCKRLPVAPFRGKNCPTSCSLSMMSKIWSADFKLQPAVLASGNRPRGSVLKPSTPL